MPARKITSSAKDFTATIGFEADMGPERADTFRHVRHPDRCSGRRSTAETPADYVLANPPFNDSDTAPRACALKQSVATQQVVSEARDKHRKDDDVRWKWSGATWTTTGSPKGSRGGANQFGVPPKGNANFAWVQHFIHHLAPQGMAGFVLANGSMSSNQSGEGEIRKAIIEADLVDCMAAFPGQLFYSTQIPVCLWFLAKNKAADAKRDFRDRRQQTLFIDARKLGTLIGAGVGNRSLN